jgi:hypothetical protein
MSKISEEYRTLLSADFGWTLSMGQETSAGQFQVRAWASRGRSFFPASLGCDYIECNFSHSPVQVNVSSNISTG